MISLLSTLILNLACRNLTQPWNVAIYLDDLPEKMEGCGLPQEGTAYKKQHSVHFDPMAVHFDPMANDNKEL